MLKGLLKFMKLLGETAWDDEGTMVRQFGMMKVQW